MKLIDRDELLRNIEADIDISVTGVRNMEAVKCCLQNILDDVKESPVVDAVPIKLLTAQAENPSNSDTLRNAIDYIVYTLWAERREE